MFKKKLLVIDDTDLMRKLISDVLQEAGYDVILAVTGQEGRNSLVLSIELNEIVDYITYRKGKSGKTGPCYT
jgi:CheY-like chemotaxis protein